MSKYDWTNVPDEVNWIATDEDGWAWGWIEEPVPKGREWLTPDGYYGIYCEFYLKPENNPFNGDLRDSLEERPK